MGAGNTRQRGDGVQSKVRRFGIRLGVAYCFMLLIPVYVWIWECLALPFTVSLTQVTVIAAVLILKIQKIFLEKKKILEKIENEKSCNLSFDHQEAIELLLNRWYEFSSPSIEKMIRTRLWPKYLTKVKWLLMLRWSLHLAFIFKHQDDKIGLSFLALLKLMKQLQFGSVKLKSFSLGEEAPKLRIVRVCPVEHDNHENSIQLNSDQMAIQFVAHVTFPKFSLEAVKWFIPLVTMQKVQISGNIKITVVLSRTLPFPNIVSATFSFTEKPDVTLTENTLINRYIFKWMYTALVEPASFQIYRA